MSKLTDEVLFYTARFLEKYPFSRHLVINSPSFVARELEKEGTISLFNLEFPGFYNFQTKDFIKKYNLKVFRLSEKPELDSELVTKIEVGGKLPGFPNTSFLNRIKNILRSEMVFESYILRV